MVFSRRFFISSVCALTAAGASMHATAADAAPRIALATTAGEIVLELNAEKAPKSVANFVQYVKNGHYNGTIFHRVIDGFMIQGGGFDVDMKEKSTRAPISNEARNGLKNEAYTVAMARTSDPDSATAQFFINVNNNAMLDYPGRDNAGYAVFGKVIKGTETVDKIRAVATADRGPHQNVPVKPVSVITARVLP
ncbi:MAG: peptidylprolyl isomerase [Pseudomonadota bacterium]